MSKILNIIFAVAFFGLCGYLLSVDSIKLFSFYGGSPSILVPPVTYLMATLPLAFGLSLLLHVIDPEKYKKHCGVIVTIGVLLFAIGVIIVAPLMKAI